jgi:hypothetical protein
MGADEHESQGGGREPAQLGRRESKEAARPRDGPRGVRGAAVGVSEGAGCGRRGAWRRSHEGTQGRADAAEGAATGGAPHSRMAH